MALHTIRLPAGEWKYDDSKPLGKAGGFGEVFLGSGEYGAVAIKRLKISADQAAHRELKIGQQLMQGSFAHVVPVLDAGQDSESDRYFLVMPVCNFSLQDKINEANGAISVDMAKSAVNAIIAGLSEVANITHRDLKPANVLFHDGVWKIADFGIAKFIEDSTSIETLRNSLTPIYAAPEQWRGERPETATDVYALGCIIHTLFSGHPPFSGSIDDLRHSHLYTAPTPIRELSPRFSAFVSQMLRKPTEARPTLGRCANVFSDLAYENNNTNHTLLGDAAKHVAETEATEEAQALELGSFIVKRHILFGDAHKELLSIKDRLYSTIKDSSESVTIDQQGRLRFGEAILDFTQNPTTLVSYAYPSGIEPYQNTGWDVLGWSRISVKCVSTSYTWSSSLLFADLKDGAGFRWYEVSFWTCAQSKSKDEPFGIEGYYEDIDLACGNITHSVNVAYGPLPLDSEDEESFISRWVGLVAKAAMGKLIRPSEIPIRDFG